MNINLNNLDRFVMKETMKVIREALDSHLTDDSDERKKQEKVIYPIAPRSIEITI